MGEFTNNYLAENGRKITIAGELFINNSVQFLGLPDFVRGSRLLFHPNLQATADPTVWGKCGTSNQNWGGIRFGPFSQTSVAWGASVDPRLAYLTQSLIKPHAAARRIRGIFLCRRFRERLRSLSNRLNHIINHKVHFWDYDR